MDKMQKYICGIINSKGQELSSLFAFTTCEEIHAISYNNIAAVVKDSEFVDYTTLPKDQLARRLLAHQQVIEMIMDSHTIIPVKLGTYALNDNEVKEILSKGYVIFKDVFGKINNKIEIDVAATWNDLNSVIKEIGGEQEIKDFKEELTAQPDGITFEDKMRIGSQIKDRLERQRDRISREIETALKDFNIDFRKHPLMDDRMVFNAAYLLDKDQKDKFEGTLDELNNRFSERINFRCVGPLPPYSFYTVEVKKIPFNDIAWAREILDLDNTATKEKINKAYKSKANVYHPDKNNVSSDGNRQFNEICRAYNILVKYCLSVEQTGMKDFCPSDEKENSQDAIIVKIKE